MGKKQVTQDLKKVQCNFFKAKKKKTKPAKIRNVLFRSVYVTSEKKKKKFVLFSVVFCCFVFKEESHRHISRSQLLVLRRQRVEGKRPTADAKILGKIYLLGWEVSSQGFTTYSYVICLLLYVYIYIISKENQNGES